MRYLLDTMVVVEPARPSPNAAAMAWLEEQAALDLAISVLTLGEIARAAARMADGRWKAVLQKWLETSLPGHFDARVLPVDEAVALAWGELTADGDRIGRSLHVVDGLLLATAKVHELVVVTRHLNDFDGRGVAVLDPYV